MPVIWRQGMVSSMASMSPQRSRHTSRTESSDHWRAGSPGTGQPTLPRTTRRRWPRCAAGARTGRPAQFNSSRRVGASSQPPFGDLGEEFGPAHRRAARPETPTGRATRRLARAETQSAIGHVTPHQLRHTHATRLASARNCIRCITWQSGRPLRQCRSGQSPRVARSVGPSSDTSR